jgi:hypothetical protein
VLLRHAALAALGLLDEAMDGQELVDFCLRCFAAGLECIYEPAALGTRHAERWPAARTEAEHLERRRVEQLVLTRHRGHVARWAMAVTA